MKRPVYVCIDERALTIVDITCPAPTPCGCMCPAAGSSPYTEVDHPHDIMRTEFHFCAVNIFECLGLERPEDCSVTAMAWESTFK